MRAAKEALEDSDYLFRKYDMQRAGVVIGSCTGGVLVRAILRDLLSRTER
jgi:acyl transferase domain-containing protein